MNYDEELYGANDFRNYELYHHGILGQKWGVRRYQNSDGTLTEAGKARYNQDGPTTIRDSKRQYRDRNRKIQNEYDDEIAKIESKYKKGQTLSDKDIAREKAASEKYNKAWDESKRQYKNDRKVVSEQNREKFKNNVKKAVDTTKEIIELSKEPDTKPTKRTEKTSVSNKSTETLAKIGTDFMNQYKKESLRRYGFENYREAMFGPASTIRVPESDLSTGERLAVNFMNSMKIVDELSRRSI